MQLNLTRSSTSLKSCAVSVSRICAGQERRIMLDYATHHIRNFIMQDHVTRKGFIYIHWSTYTYAMSQETENLLSCKQAPHLYGDPVRAFRAEAIRKIAAVFWEAVAPNGCGAVFTQGVGIKKHSVFCTDFILNFQHTETQTLTILHCTHTWNNLIIPKGRLSKYKRDGVF